MVGEGQRLRFLQVSETRHGGVNVFFHEGMAGFDQGKHLVPDGKKLVSCIELHIKSHLVVAASSGVQLLAGVADAVDEGGLHEAVDILVLIGDLQRAVFHVGEDSLDTP